ncbi:nicotinamide riboside transporter PnuC [Catenuloplanes japonicus]|uniref:nicotinamide riboside transporter PnuC n=1 Tax=Catenuloplanes japonicus TaxID=33876 RepID=UPI0005273EFF|nr:nicotinamide riboside transporter PnuC [Catenuloplanes japonicus]
MVLDWLNSTAVTAFGAPTSWAEVLGFATGALCVWLVVRQHIANWPLGIANVLLLLLVFLDAKLYADAGLQVVYVVLNAYGWWHWHTGRGQAPLPVRRTTRVEWIGQIVAGIAATAALTWWLTTHTDSTTELPDAATTALSLMATYGQSRKLLESWWLWIAADLIYIPLYGYKGLWLTALLYVLFLCLCIAGLRSWRRTV